MSWTFLVLQQQQNVGRRFRTSNMHLSPPPPRWLRLLSVLRRWFCCCWFFCLLLLPLWESVIILCFVVRYFMSILVLQSSWWGRESWLLCLICLRDGWVALLRGAMGLAAVCDCGIFWSYSFTIFGAWLLTFVYGSVLRGNNPSLQYSHLLMFWNNNPIVIRL